MTDSRGPRAELNEILVVLHQLHGQLDRVDAELKVIDDEMSRLAMAGAGFSVPYRRPPEHGPDLGETVDAAYRRTLEQQAALWALLSEYDDRFLAVFSSATEPET